MLGPAIRSAAVAQAGLPPAARSPAASAAPGGRLAGRLKAALDDVRVRGALFQVAVFAALGLLLAYLASNASANLARQSIASGFGFLWREAGFGIGESLIRYAPSDTYARALLVGVLNTVQVAVAVCVASTLLGVAIGVARLSANPLLARLEVVRNVPLIIQLFFWYAIVRQLPAPRQALRPVEGVFLSNRGVLLPGLVPGEGAGLVVAALAVGAAAAWWLARRARRVRIERGGAGGMGRPWHLALPAAGPALALLAFPGAFTASVPVLAGFNFRGGLALSPEFVALFAGMTIYAAAFTAEIVRAGILAVPRGQWETAASLGLRRLATLRLVVLPQSLRIAIPPMTSQYLNNTKNSSLAVAIGYPDLVSVSGTTMNQTGQALEAILIFMSVYLALSLTTSLAMNAFNRRAALRER
jgi:general L-amino acid transport system permease protein